MVNTLTDIGYHCQKLPEAGAASSVRSTEFRISTGINWLIQLIIHVWEISLNLRKLVSGS